MDVAVAGLATYALPLRAVPAVPRLVPAPQVVLDVRAELAVALGRLALLDARADGLGELPAAEKRAIWPLCGLGGLQNT